MTNQDENYWFPVTCEGMRSYLKTFSPGTQQYFNQMLDDPKACKFLRTYFIKIEDKFMSKSLEEYSSLREVYKEVDEKGKAEVAKQNWITKHIFVPMFTPLISKQIGIPYHELRKKNREQVADAMFLVGVYLHL